MVIFELYSLQLTLVTELCVWMHSLTRSIHYAQGRPCLYVFVYGALWFHGSITLIDRRWFTDNPWLCFHIGPHEERRWLWASRVLESELHVALDSHLFLCIRPLTLCPFFSLYCFISKTFSHGTAHCRFDFILLTGHRYDYIRSKMSFSLGRSVITFFSGAAKHILVTAGWNNN